MAEKMTVMAKWFADVREDPYLELTEQDMAYIMYATIQYGLTGEKTNFGEIFGDGYRALSMAMPNIYGQIDNIQHYNEGVGTVKYDKDAIKELSSQGMTAKQVCEALGYPLDKAKSITSNKGWIEGRKMWKANGGVVQKNTDSASNFQAKSTENTDLGRSVQKSTESVQTENTEKYRSVQNLSKLGFNF